jgi:hypothetical protein
MKTLFLSTKIPHDSIKNPFPSTKIPSLQQKNPPFNQKFLYIQQKIPFIQQKNLLFNKNFSLSTKIPFNKSQSLPSFFQTSSLPFAGRT